MNTTTVTCLMCSKDGKLAVKLFESPIPATHTESYPQGVIHACRVLGLASARTWKLTAEGSPAMYEEQ